MSSLGQAPVQPTLRRLRAFAVRPDRDLGQNFLIDSNILGVIERASELEREDTVLEIGGGLGVLSEHLAERVRHVHVVEVDGRLRAALEDATAHRANVTVHWADAMALDLERLQPAPNKLVSNLPYGIAAGVLLRTIHELPTIELWVAMLQREVGERLASGPGSAAYGTPSVLAQLECEVQVLRAIPRSVFYPVPNVDSVLVRMRRRAEPARAARGADAQALRALVSGSFAHRRKTLAGSLALAGGAPAGGREQVRAALERLGHAPDVRAERLAPEEFAALARALEL